MGILEIVFNSRKFDLNDDVLMGFDNYFDKKSKDYNSFCLDEEDINPLQNFVAQIKSADSDSVIYVSTYGYEITNSKGEKSTYADALWIDTVLPISQIERYIEKSGVACWVYVQKYVKHKTLDEMLQEWSGASKFILAMDTWFERLMADQ